MATRAASARAMPDRSGRAGAAFKSRCLKQGRHRGLLADAEFDHDVPVRDNETPRVRGDRAIAIEAVRAAVERQLRIVPHLGGQAGQFARGDIGRINHHEIEAAAERGTEIAGDELCARFKLVTAGVVARRLQRATLRSVAMPNAFGSSESSARRRAPLPVPRSAMRSARWRDPPASIAASAASTTVSVSGRGTSVAGVTRNGRPQNSLKPMMRATGSPLSLRAASASIVRNSPACSTRPALLASAA